MIDYATLILLALIYILGIVPSACPGPLMEPGASYEQRWLCGMAIHIFIIATVAIAGVLLWIVFE